MKCLFVGGPLDGQVRNHSPELDHVTASLWGDGALSMRTVTYRPRKISGVRLWAPEHCSDDAVMRQLVKRYSTLIERAARRSAA